ncbi:MAG TPA: SRPBCC family protein [Verrucomicrobiae bacterium]|nr:SRPBCC family protein [Verrucomicrobiae bacterium]
MKNAPQKWTQEYSIETSATPEVVWRIFSDVPGWKKWNAGIEQIEMTGPFAVGSQFVMTPPGQEPLMSRLVEVRENEVFVDETRVDELIVLVAHRIGRVSAYRTRVTYAVEAIGPGCAEIGPAVSSDFPDVLKSLVRLAESKI